MHETHSGNIPWKAFDAGINRGKNTVGRGGLLFTAGQVIYLL